MGTSSGAYELNQECASTLAPEVIYTVKQKCT